MEAIMIFVFVFYITNNEKINLVRLSSIPYRSNNSYIYFEPYDTLKFREWAQESGNFWKLSFGIIGNVTSLFISLSTILFKEESPNDFYTYVAYRLTTDVLLTSTAIWGTGKILGIKSNFYKTVISVIIGDILATGIALSSSPSSGGWFWLALSSVIFLPPIFGTIGSNL